MGYFKTRGLRGNALEELINFTNDLYRQKGIALIQKIPTPITPVKKDSETGNITLAFFEKKSTVDYIGLAQGIPLCFDAKETKQKSLPMQNIHEHQIKFMEDFEKQKGYSFLLVCFSALGEYYIFPFDKLKKLWTNAQNGGKKHIPYTEFEERFLIKYDNNGILNYLKTVNEYIKYKDENTPLI